MARHPPMAAVPLPYHPAWLMLWLPLLVGLQGVPHTGGLRTLALVAGLIHVATLVHGMSHPAPLIRDRLVAPTFGVLLIWLLFQTVFLAAAPTAAFRALAEDWGKLILVAILGLGLAKAIRQTVWLHLALFAGAFLHVLSVLGYQISSLSSGRGLAFKQSWLSEYPLASYFCISAIIWLVADVFARNWHRPALFPWPSWLSLLLLGCSVLAEALLQTKSGHVVLAAIGLAVVLMLLFLPGTNRLRRLALGMVMLLVLSGVTLLAGSDRWHGLARSLGAAQSARLPLQAFISDDAPIPEGSNHSLYLRAVRGWQGVQGIFEHPFGIGYSPDVYRRHLEERFGLPNGISSSNSGLIDFGLAVGMPGLVLLLTLCAGLIRQGWRAFLFGQTAGMVLVLFVIHQLGHYVLDGTLGGSRFTGPVLTIAALWGLSRISELANVCASCSSRPPRSVT